MNGSENVNVTTGLSWNVTNSENASLTYDVYFGVHPEEALYEPVAYDVNETWYYPETLNYSTTYFWMIDVFDGVNWTQGELWNFTTVFDNSTDHHGWNVTLEVEVFGGSDYSALNATFGMRDGANSSFNGDVGEKILPPGFAGVESYFYYPDESSSPIDYRKLYVSYLNETYPANWTFYVHTFSGVSGDAEMHWNTTSVYDIPDSYYVVMDSPTGYVDMRSTDYYSWTAAENTYYEFTIMVYEPV